MTLMAITNQTPIINIQKIKRREPKHNTKESHETAREESKRRRTENYYKNRMAISTYISIIILNINGISPPIE